MDGIWPMLIYEGESELGWQARDINLRLLHSPIYIATSTTSIVYIVVTKT